MADLIGMMAGAAGGGLFGLVGTVLGRVASFAERRQEQAHERARWAHEGELLVLQMKAEQEENEGRIALAGAQGTWAGLSASIAADAAIAPSYPIVDAVRGLTRPVLTVLLWLIAAGIYIASDAAGRADITQTATFAATAATLWWFGDRGPRRQEGS